MSNRQGMTRISRGVYEDQYGEIHVFKSELDGGGGVSGVGGYGDDDDDISGIEDADDAFGDNDAAAAQYLATEIGRTPNRKKQAKIRRRLEKRAGRLEDRGERRGVDLRNVTDDDDKAREKKNMSGWTGTALGGSWTASGADVGGSITITPQHRFRANNFKATGVSGSTVVKITFADKLIWSGSVAVDFLGGTSTLQALVAGAEIGNGYSIIVDLVAAGAGLHNVVFDGWKPSTQC